MANISAIFQTCNTFKFLIQFWLIFRSERTPCVKGIFLDFKLNSFLSSYTHITYLINTNWTYLIDPLFTCSIKPKTSLGLYVLPITVLKFRALIYRWRTGAGRTRIMLDHLVCNIEIIIIARNFISNIVFSIIRHR